MWTADLDLCRGNSSDVAVWPLEPPCETNTLNLCFGMREHISCLSRCTAVCSEWSDQAAEFLGPIQNLHKRLICKSLTCEHSQIQGSAGISEYTWLLPFLDMFGLLYCRVSLIYSQYSVSTLSHISTLDDATCFHSVRRADTPPIHRSLIVADVAHWEPECSHTADMKEAGGPSSSRVSFKLAIVRGQSWSRPPSSRPITLSSSAYFVCLFKRFCL